MDLPQLLLIAIDRGIGRFYNEVHNVAVPPGGNVPVSIAPTSDAIVWVVWKITWGNLAVGQLNIRLDHGSLIPTTDLDLTSRVAWEEALWIYAEKDKPLTVTLTNPGGVAQTIDFTVWMVQISVAARSILRKWIYGKQRILECAAEGPCLWELLMKLLPPAVAERVKVPEPVERDAE